MAQYGDTITYTYSSSGSSLDPVAEDISQIDAITVEYIDAAGGESNDSSVSGGSGGRVENVIADVSGFDTLYIWVSGSSLGRYYGYAEGGTPPQPPIGEEGFAEGTGGGSSEISVVNTNFEDSDTEPFIAAAGGGGGAGGYNVFGDGYHGARAESTYDREPNAGIQPPLGGEGGASSDDSTLVEDGSDGEGAVSGHNSSVPILDSGTSITGGGAGSNTNGEIRITFSNPVKDGDEITYTYSGAKETEDISAIDEISIDRMDGADGEDGNGTGGSGGLIEGATANVSEYNTLDIYVGGQRFGHATGGGFEGLTAYSGGSTELFTDTQIVTETNLGITIPSSSADSSQISFSLSNTPSGKITEMRDPDGNEIPFSYKDTEDIKLRILNANTAKYHIRSLASSEQTLDEVDYEVHSAFIAAADSGGSGTSPPLLQTGEFDGHQGARADGAVDDDGGAGGTGFGGSAQTDSGGEPAGDGGQELGIASGGTLTTGGSADGDGEIQISYVSNDTPSPVEVNGTEITAIEVDGQEISLSEVKNIEINGQDI